MLKKILNYRWTDIVLLSLVAIAIVEISSKSHWLVRNFNSWAEISTSLPSYLQLIVGIFGLYCIYKLLLDFKIFHPNHFRRPYLQFKYPPIYFSAILGVGGLLFVENFDVNLPVRFNVLGVIVILFVVSAVLHQHETFTTLEKDKQPKLSAATEEHNEEFVDYLKNKGRKDLIEFYTWLHKEEPTQINKLDDFDRYIYVERISKILLSKRNAPCHLALMGAFGSGKSSVTNTIVSQVEAEDSSYIFVNVDGWGRSDKSCAAQILEEIIESLSKHVDCSSIRNIPKNYIDALIGTNLSGSKFFANWAQRYHSPLETLENIQTILEATNSRLLIVLEDFDRQINSNDATSEIAALLDRLKKHNRINFIINIGYQTNNEVISKICTRREDLGNIHSERKIEQLFDLMDEYESYKHPLNINKDKSLIPQLAKDMSTNIKTPRDLKHVLRRSFSIWENLAGEIDIYDLLNLNIIRFTNPKAFDHICTNINELKKMTIDQEFAKLSGGTLKYFEKSANSEKFSAPDPINYFIEKIFPNASESEISVRPVELLRNQRVAFIGETDFFYRILLEKTDDKSDVSALNKIKLLANADSDEAKNEILEISKSIFLIEKVLQYYRYEYSETKIRIIDQKIIYILLMILTKKDNLDTHRNIEMYLESFHMNELIKIFIQLGNSAHIIEVIKQVCVYSLHAALILIRAVGIRNLEIPYEEAILDSLKTPKALRISLNKSHTDTLLSILTEIFMFRTKSAIYLDKYMSLVLETLIEFPDIKPFVENLLYLPFSAEIAPEKLTAYQDQVVLLKAQIK